MAGEENTTLKNVEIFRAGRWRGNKAIEVTPSMLDQIVGNFHQLNSKVSGYGVPIKLGHNERVGEPAYGWMSDLQRVGDVLVADFSDVDPAIVDAISKRRYNSVSIELYPRVDYADKSFTNVLGGVALLGAEWPAVKGLKPLSGSLFSEDAEKLVLSFKEIEDVKTFTEQEHADLMAAAVSTAVKDLSDKLTASESARTIAETALKSFKQDATKAQMAEVIKAAEVKGVVVPANKSAVEAMATALLSNASDGAAMVATFKGFVEGLAPKVNLKEEGAAAKAAVLTEGAKARDEIDARAKKLLSEKKAKNYEEAVQAVFAADPDLKTRYAEEK